MYMCVSGPEGGAIVVDALAGQQLRSRYRRSQRQSDGYAILIVSMFDTQETVFFLFIFPLICFCFAQSKAAGLRWLAPVVKLSLCCCESGLV